jgi:Zn-dependent protease/CBS domain-containing protein
MPTGGGSIQLARIFGIRIGVTASWFVILFVFIFLLSGSFRDTLGGSDTRAYGVAVAATLLFYVSIVLHELGHAFVARRQGIGVESIDLWFFGGLARLDRDPRTPGAEFAVAIAGPLVTLAITAVCAGAASMLEGGDRFLDAATLQSAGTPTAGFVLLSFLATINFTLFAFNLIPAFPLDGGRIALALAWRLTGSRARATRLAGWAGVGFGYLLTGLGVYFLLTGNVGDGIWFAVLGWLLAGSARSAVVSGTMQERLTEVTVADVMDPHPVTLDGETPLLDAHERIFEANGWPFVAVVDGAGHFLGVLSRAAAEQHLQEGRPALPVREAVHDDPEAWHVGTDQPLEALLRTDGLRRLGAVFAVDGEGVLKGVVTLEQLRRAITPAASR